MHRILRKVSMTDGTLWFCPIWFATGLMYLTWPLSVTLLGVSSSYNIFTHFWWTYFFPSPRSSLSMNMSRLISCEVTSFSRINHFLSPSITIRFYFIYYSIIWLRQAQLTFRLTWETGKPPRVAFIIGWNKSFFRLPSPRLHLQKACLFATSFLINSFWESNGLIK